MKPTNAQEEYIGFFLPSSSVALALSEFERAFTVSIEKSLDRD